MRHVFNIVFILVVFCFPAFSQTYEHIASSDVLKIPGAAISTGLVMPYANQSIGITQRISDNHSRFTSSGIRQALPSRRGEYLGATVYGLQGRQRIAEQIGDLGAKAYARNMGFQPVYESTPGQGRGFDAIYRNQSNQIIVVEAKGGSSPAKIYRGFRQGTPEYALALAHDRLRSPLASLAEKQGARDVIRAHREGRLVSQVVRTDHVYGAPGKTTVNTTSGRLVVASSVAVAHRIAVRTGVVAGLLVGTIDVFSQIGNQADFNHAQVAGSTVLGFASAYAGSLSGMSVGALARSSAPRFLAKVPILSGITGSTVAGALYSYGGYFMGMHSLQSAHQGMGLSLLGGAAGTLTGIGMMSVASAFGTASTGTAISSLSGAAATNASLAWWGGGSLAAGGGGAAAGSLVVAGTTVGVVLVVPLVYVGIKYYWSVEDEKKRIEGMIKAVKQHCDDGRCILTTPHSAYGLR